MEAILIALATSFNILIIKFKLEKHRYEDAALDTTVLVLLAMVFSGSLGGMVIATITSFIVSLSLLINPPKFLSSIDTKSFIDEFKTKLPQK